MKWKDETSYSRSEKDRVPRTWEMRTESIRIVVTRIHGIPDEWYLRVYGLMNIDRQILTEDDIDEAKLEALRIVLEKSQVLTGEVMDIFEVSKPLSPSEKISQDIERKMWERDQ